MEQVASAVLYMDSLPLETNVPFMTILATQMPFIGRGQGRARRFAGAAGVTPAPGS